MDLESIADAYRQAACGRVVAMLTTKDDAPEQVVRNLASAIEPPVVAKPVLRADVCVVMMLVGALVVLVWNHVRTCAQGTPEDVSDLESEGDSTEG